MQKHLRNLIIGIGSFIIFIFLVQLIFVKLKGQPEFSYPAYKEQQVVFNTCYGSELASVQEKLQAFMEHTQETQSIMDLKTTIFDELPKTNCEVSFVSSNDDQIRDMAQRVLEEGQTYYGSKAVKLLDTVYTVEESFAAYLQSPRPYLFFALVEDETQMVGFQVIPQETGYKINALWDVEASKDDAFVQREVGKLLYIYNIKAF